MLVVLYEVVVAVLLLVFEVLVLVVVFVVVVLVEVVSVSVDVEVVPVVVVVVGNPSQAAKLYTVQSEWNVVLFRVVDVVDVCVDVVLVNDAVKMPWHAATL